MTWRKAHGTGADALVRVEQLPVDELPLGVQEPPQASARGERRPNGTFARGARTVQSAGGKATKGKTRLAARLGLSRLPEDAAFRPYKAQAARFRRIQCAELARTVGGGVCGPAPSSIIASAALALAWSRYFSDLAALSSDADAPELATRALRLADQSRQMLLTAHELAAREGEARARRRPAADYAAALAAASEPVRGPTP